jgi:hypothetical protein
MHRNSWLMFERNARGYIESGARVLEIGPDAVPSTYQARNSVGVACWDTLDLPGSTPFSHQLTEPYRFPFADNSYDVVISGQVIEHIPKI